MASLRTSLTEINRSSSLNKGRILVCTGHFWPHVGGVERYTQELWTRMANRGWDVTILTTNTDRSLGFEQIGPLKVMRLSSFKLIQERLPVPVPTMHNLRTIRKIRAWEPQVIVTNTRFFPTTAMGVWLAQRWNVPALHIDHGSQHVQVGFWIGDRVSEAIDHTVGEWVLKRASRVVGVSRSVSAFLAHLKCRNAGVLYNGIDTDAFPEAKGGWRSQLGIPSHHFMVLYVGRLIEDKGVRTLVEAIRILDKSLPLTLVVAGDGHMMDWLQVQKSALASLKPLGNVGASAVAGLMADSDVFVHPSSYPEGLPTAVLEAAASGCAIIATPMGGTAEIIVSDNHGVLVRPNQPELMAREIYKLLMDEPKRLRVGATVQAHVKSTFDWERIADVAEDEVLSLLTLRKPPC